MSMCSMSSSIVGMVNWKEEGRGRRDVRQKENRETEGRRGEEREEVSPALPAHASPQEVGRWGV